MSDYPILEEHRLPTIARGRLRGARRDPQSLPQPRANAALVAVSGQRFQELPPLSNFRGSEDVLVAASDIIVVDTSPATLITSEFSVASADLGQEFSVSLTFACTVEDVLTVAREAPRDLSETLGQQYRDDRKLARMGLAHKIEQLASFRADAKARIAARARNKPPQIPGMNIVFKGADVAMPNALATQGATMQQLRFEHEIAALKGQFAFQQAELLEALLRRGPEAIEALWLQLNDPRYASAVDRAYGNRERLQQQLQMFIGTFHESGHFDNVAFDTPRLVDAFLSSLLPPRAEANGAPSSFVLGDSSGRSVAAASDESVEEIGRPERSPADDLDVE